MDPAGLEPGDQIKVYVLQPENEEGNVVLSLRRARAETTWLVAAEKQTDGTVIDADVREQNKGGLIVNILGLRGFLPSSQVARAYAGSLESLVGKRIPVKILEVNRKRNRLIVSQKAAEDEDRARKREELFSRLQTGTTVKGTVSGITSYGAFVDIGGADGLIHISELSWDRVSKVTDVLQLGEEVTVKVIKLDPEQTRISLSLRQLQQDPWERLVQSMPVGSIVEGQVTKTKKYGAFLQIMPGIEGLLHISADRGRAEGRRDGAGQGDRHRHGQAADLAQPQAAVGPAGNACRCADRPPARRVPRRRGVAPAPPTAGFPHLWRQTRP